MLTGTPFFCAVVIAWVQANRDCDMGLGSGWPGMLTDTDEKSVHFTWNNVIGRTGLEIIGVMPVMCSQVEPASPKIWKAGDQRSRYWALCAPTLTPTLFFALVSFVPAAD